MKYPYWAETGKWETDNAYVWVKVSLIPAAGCTIKMWYGNPSASSESDRAATTGIGTEPHAGIRGYSNWVGIGGQRSTARTSDGTLHCVYTATGTDSIYYSYSSDGGQTWSEGIDIDGVGYESYASAIAIDSSDNLHVAWYGGGSPSVPGCAFNIQYRQRAAAGTWGSVEHVTDVASYQDDPSVAVDSHDSIHVVWEGSGIQYRQKTSAGWQVQSNPSSGQVPLLLWARHHTINGVMTNVPHQGYIYVHYSPTAPYAVWYYGSPGTAVVFGSALTEPTYIIGGQSPSGAEDPIPELSTIALLGTGMAVLSSYIWIRNKSLDRAVPV
ncbi:MAG: DUF2341 domain-containing protein [Dehalococcoidia bacterium]|nr:DUF2341 domain-containing protein [Dehalococcoidia bacterium]